MCGFSKPAVLRQASLGQCCGTAVRSVLTRGWGGLALVLALNACGGARPAALPADPVRPDAGIAANLPVLPDAGAPASPARRVSDSAVEIKGEDCVQHGGAGNFVDAPSHTLALVPGGERELAWALYTLDGLDAERPVSLDLAAQALAPAGEEALDYWVLVSDYSNYRWEAHGPFRGAAHVVLNSAGVRQRYVSRRSGAVQPTFSCAVVALGNAANADGDAPGEQPRVEIASATTALRTVADTGYVATNAHFTEIATVTRSGSALGKRASAVDPVEITWDHVFDNTAGNKNEAIFYQVARSGPGDPADTGLDLQELIIGALNAPGEFYADPADNFGNKPAPRPGETYRYYLRGYSINNGYSGWDTDIALVTIPMPAVANVAATDDSSPSQVQVTWDAAVGIKGYQVLRDTDSNPAGAVNVSGLLAGGATAQYDDVTALPGTVYYYWVQPVGEGATLDSADDLDSVAEGAPLSVAETGVRSLVLTVVCSETPPPPGDGSAGSPYQLGAAPATYGFRVEDQLGNDLTALATWSVDPPISAAFNPGIPGLLEDVWSNAGAFQAMAVLGAGPYSWSAAVACEVGITGP